MRAIEMPRSWRRRRREWQGWRAALVSEHAAFVSLAILLAALFLGGGGSRSDIASLVILRPLSVLACAHGWLVLQAQGRRTLAPVAAMALALMALCVLQLVPLPPALWQALPGRALDTEIAAVLGMEAQWRALTLSPAGTLNALFALFAPLGVAWLFAALGRGYRHRIFIALLLAGAASIALSLLQMAGPARGPLYLYRVTSEGYAVGLFANRNHNAVFLAALVPLAACLCAGLAGRLKALMALGLFALFVTGASLAIVLSGSRAGLLCLSLALPAAALVLRRAFAERYARQAWLRHAWLAPTLIALPAIALTALAGKATALERLLGQDGLGHRGDILPALFAMLRDSFPAGTGMGSFAQAYPRYEPLETMQPLYLNHAHNDWLQWAIEGGLPAVVLLTGGALLLARAAWCRLRNRSQAAQEWCLQAACTATIAIFAVASLADYPLRTPVLMAMVALAASALTLPQRTAE